MKCPKCGYHSFDHLDSCKKCGHGLAEHKAKFSLRGFFFPGQVASAEPAPVEAETLDDQETPDSTAVDFGFDFLDQEEDQVGSSGDSFDLDGSAQPVNIDQPFGADSEMIPADDQDDDPDNKPGKGPEFAF